MCRIDADRQCLIVNVVFVVVIAVTVHTSENALRFV